MNETGELGSARSQVRAGRLYDLGRALDAALRAKRERDQGDELPERLGPWAWLTFARSCRRLADRVLALRPFIELDVSAEVDNRRVRQRAITPTTSVARLRLVPMASKMPTAFSFIA